MISAKPKSVVDGDGGGSSTPSIKGGLTSKIWLNKGYKRCYTP